MVFQCLLTMALWGSIAAIVVLAARPLVKKISNRIMCLLWLVVLFRFLCPVAFEREIPAAWTNKLPRAFANLVQIEQEPEPQLEKVSLMERPNLKSSSHGTETSTAPIVVSTIEKMAKEVEAALETTMEPSIETSYVTAIETTTESTEATVIDLSGLKENFPMILGGIWILGGIAVMLGSMIKYYTIRRSLKEAILIRKWGTYPVMITDFSDVPMSFGIFHPGIYIPIVFDRAKRDVNGAPLTERQKDMIIWHEYMHLRRHDPLLKLLVYVMFSIHWWNPLVWMCVKCINQDIEMACDETVLSFIGRKKRGEYAEILLGFATEQNGISFMASFGEGHAESRIKNALRFHKASIGVTGATLLFAFALGSCLSVRPVAAKEMTDQVSGGDALATLQVSGGDALAGDFVPQVSSGDALAVDMTQMKPMTVDGFEITEADKDPRMYRYRRFKTDEEKVYFFDFDGSMFHGLDFDVEKGYSFSQLMACVNHYFEPYNGERHYNIRKDMVYLDCGQDGAPEMALIFENLSNTKANLNEKGSLILIFKEINGQILFAYGCETSGFEGLQLDFSGLIARSGDGSKYHDTYELGVLDSKAKYHEIYTLNAQRDVKARDYFNYQPGEISYCQIHYGDEEPKDFYISTNPLISDEELFRVMNSLSWNGNNSHVTYSNYISEMCKTALERRRINSSVLWANVVFRSEHYLDEKEMDISVATYEKYFAWE